MLNQIVLVGRLTSDLEVKELEGGKKLTTMTLAIPRSFKNENGEYETDFITCRLYNNIAENTAEYCKKGDIVGVKGRLQNNSYTEYLQQSLEVYEDYKKEIEDRKATKEDKEFYNNLIEKIEKTEEEIRKNRFTTEVIAEKVTFLSSRSSNESEEK